MSVKHKARDSFNRRGYNSCPVCIENETEQFLLINDNEDEVHEVIQKFMDIEYLLTQAAVLPQILQKCSACKLTNYCSIGHQKFHWSNTKIEMHRGPIANYHKDFCKAAMQILNKRDIYIHEYMGEIKTRQDITKSIIELLKMFPNIMGRKLSPWERNCILYPKYCNTCLKFRTINKFSCNICRCIHYCSEECRLADFEYHKRYCEELRISYNLFTVIEDYNLKLEFYGPPINFYMEYDTITVLEKCTQMRIPRLPQTLADYQIFSTASDYGYAMTMYTILERCNTINPHIPMEHFVVYLIGRNTWLTTTQSQFLITRMPNIKNMTFVMLGHVFHNGKEMIKRLGISQYTRDSIGGLTACPVSLKQSFLDELRTTPPNLIICFNANFTNDTSYGEPFKWTDLINEFLKIKNLPIAFTTFSFRESEYNLNLFYKAAYDARVGCSIIIQNEYNKFRELVPIRNWNYYLDDNILIYANSFINVVACY